MLNFDRLCGLCFRSPSWPCSHFQYAYKLAEDGDEDQQRLLDVIEGLSVGWTAHDNRTSVGLKLLDTPLVLIQ